LYTARVLSNRRFVAARMRLQMLRQRARTWGELTGACWHLLVLPQPCNSKGKHEKIVMLLVGMKRSSSIAAGQPLGGAVRNSLASVAFCVAPALGSAGMGACSSSE
jgi:hypothetical protein